MVHDKSNLIPINRAILIKFRKALEMMNQHCIAERPVNATFITFEGFMRSENINYGGGLYRIPKYKPTSIESLGVDILKPITTDVMEFQLDRFKSTNDHLIFQQVK